MRTYAENVVLGGSFERFTAEGLDGRFYTGLLLRRSAVVRRTYKHGIGTSAAKRGRTARSRRCHCVCGSRRNLLDSLPSLDSIDERNRDTTIETLRQVAEVLVWGEQHNRGYFDIFCEQNVLSYFVGLAEQQTVPSAVKVQLLQSLSIIVQSINKETAVCKF